MTPPALPPGPRWTWLPLPPGTPAEPLARAWLGEQLGCAAGDVPLVRDGRGRPRLVSCPPRFDCNWSHSGEGLLVALVEGGRVGIDLESLRPRSRALALARRFFDPAEAGWLKGLDEAEQARSFLRLWCAKEALLKAHGHGISFGLDRLRFTDTAEGLRLQACDPALGAVEAWSIRELRPAPGYVGALAWNARGAAPEQS